MAGNHRARRRHLVPAVAAASIALCAGAATAIALAPGGDSAGDPYFPDAGQRRLRRRPLLARPRLQARQRKARRDRDDRGHRDPGAERLQPRLSGAAGALGDGRRPAGGVRALRAGADGDARGRDRLRGRRSRSWSPTAAGRGRFATPTARSRAGSRPTTAPSSPASRRARRPGSPATTTRPTRRPSTSRSPSRAGSRRSPTGRWSSAGATVDRVTWRWAAEQPMAAYLATATIGQFRRRAQALRRARVAGRGRPARGAGGEATAAADQADHPLLLEAVRAVSVRADRGDRRPRAGRSATRSRPRPARSTPSRPVGGHRRPRDRPPVVRRLGQRRALAGHLAQRGLRDLGGVALGRAARRPDDGAGVLAARAHAGEPHQPLGPAARRTRAARGSCSASSVYIRGGMALEALRQRIGERDLPRPPARLGRRAHLRQRHDRRVHRAGRGAFGPGARRRSSSATCSSRASPRRTFRVGPAGSSLRARRKGEPTQLREVA